jgi:hypothetical protein
LAPAHLTKVALFKYFADGHFGFDDESHLNHHGGGGGGLFKKKTLKVADLLKFGKKPIKVPLHRALWSSEVVDQATRANRMTTGLVMGAEQMEKRAVENFKNIMRYMGDLELDDRTLAMNIEIQNIERDGMRSKILQMGLSTVSNNGGGGGGNGGSASSASSGVGSSMCDEIWCQLIKQTTGNPKHDSLVGGWELLASISSIFKPSVELFPCAFQFVYERCFDTNEIGALAVHTLRELMRQRDRNQHVNTPSARHQANLISKSSIVQHGLFVLWWLSSLFFLWWLSWFFSSCSNYYLFTHNSFTRCL